MFKWLYNRIAAFWDNIAERLSSIWHTFTQGLQSFFRGEGGILRMACDIGACFLIALASPIMVMGFAAASFVDSTNSVTAICSAILAYFTLEILALWFMELVILLAALQFSRISNRYLYHVKRRSLSYNAA